MTGGVKTDGRPTPSVVNCGRGVTGGARAVGGRKVVGTRLVTCGRVVTVEPTADGRRAPSVGLGNCGNGVTGDPIGKGERKTGGGASVVRFRQLHGLLVVGDTGRGNPGYLGRCVVGAM